LKNASLTSALIVLDAVLVVLLAALWFAPGPLAHWRNWQAPTPQAPNLDNARTAELAPNPAVGRDYPAIVERPLFIVDRKPRATASDAAAAAPPLDSLDHAKLYGVVDGRPAAQGVLLEQDSQPRFVRRGEKVGDWTLQAIDGRDAIFANDSGKRRTVTLPDSLSNGVAAQASTSAASAPAHAAVFTPVSANTPVAPIPLAATRPTPPQALQPRPAMPAPPPGNAPLASFGGGVSARPPSVHAPSSSSTPAHTAGPQHAPGV
jgi:hypothetical protein